MAQSDIIKCSVNGGDDQYSYSKNSNFQKKAIENVKELITKGIIENLDVKTLTSSSQTLQIADLGSAAGPNTFFAVQTIIDAIEQTLKPLTLNHLDFHVFFNDQPSNDFNHLFQTLPSDRSYFASGTPGSFYGRLFPRHSLHFVHSSYCLQILSRTPPEVLREDSPAWNGGRVHYLGSSDDVARAYVAQYERDLERFLEVRAEEIVSGGLMAFVVPGRISGTHHDKCLMCRITNILGSCFVDFANQGKIGHEKVDSLNFPMYFASLEEIESVVNRNRNFKIEIMENVAQEKPDPKALAITMRSGMGSFIGDHFKGQDFNFDEFFDLLAHKFQQNTQAFESADSIISLFVMLKRI